MSCLLVVIAVAFATPASAENLVANPGFEQLKVDQPARWDVFVAPQPGATGKLVPEASAGEYAVMLHTPLPYDREPLNNWSQNILRDDLGGKTLRAEAQIKVAEATEAALWVQCWRRQPWTLLHTANSSFDAPIYGTQDWQTVSMTFDAPAGTDYLAVRCVLIGTGSAWFDEVTVRTDEDAAEAEAASDAAAPAEEEAAPGDEGTSAGVDALIIAVPRVGVEEKQDLTTDREAELPVQVRSQAKLENEGQVPALGNAIEETPEAATPPPAMVDPADVSEVLTETLDQTRDEGRALAESIAQLEAANRALQEELVQIREEVLTLQAAPEPAPRTPPLVPHGVEWMEEIR